MISIQNVSKSYASGVRALEPIDLEIRKGEIFALLGPNGAGKTTLINIVCGIVTASSGRVTADGHDIVRDYRAARTKIGLVPQELTTDSFETVWATVSFSRGLFGRAPNPAYLTGLLRDLSLSEKRDSRIMDLSGGMKRRVMIAKALSHEPDILFLDEPTAGVDVELRRDMWNLVRSPARTRRDHHLDHALYRGSRGDGRSRRRHQQGLARPGRGEGGADAQVRQEAADPAPADRRSAQIPAELAPWHLELKDQGLALECTFDGGSDAGIPLLLQRMSELSIAIKDLQTHQSSLEDIFVSLVSERAPSVRT